MNVIRNLLEMQKVYKHFSIFVRVSLLDVSTWAASWHRCKSDATLFYLPGTAVDLTFLPQRIDIDVETAGDDLSFVLAHEFAHIEQMIREVPFNEEEADKRALEILEENAGGDYCGSFRALSKLEKEK